VNNVPTFSSTAEALGTLRAAMSFLAAADATAMPTAVQAQCLQGLEEIDSIETVARASILRAFSSGQGYCGDGEFSAKTWLVHKTRITGGAAVIHMRWVRRTAGHPVVAAALTEPLVSEPWARVICQLTDRLPAEHRDEGDAILLAAVRGGATLEDLLALGQKMYEMSRSGTPDRDGGYGDSCGDDGAGEGASGEGASGGEDGCAGEGGAGRGVSSGEGGTGEGASGGHGSGTGGSGEGSGCRGGLGGVFDDRSVRLVKTMDGAGVLVGDLTPECAAVVGKVLDALSARAGAEDTRTLEQRRHDALEEAMRRLIAADMIPARAGQPVKVLAHIELLDLIELDAGSALIKRWTLRVRAQWAAARAAASETGGDGGVWLEGEAAGAFACDAGITPVVVGEVNLAALDALVRLCGELGGYGPGRCGPGRTHDGDRPGDPGDRCGDAGDMTSGGGQSAGGDRPGGNRAGGCHGSGPVPPTDRGRAALEQAIIGKAVELLSGPGGLASFLRRGLLGARLGGPSLPLDVGMSENVPAAIRTAVILRDQHCRWAGGCSQPAPACHVHHVRHRARGGKTSVKDCVLLCPFHHLIAIHRWGWTLALNGDGTTTAWNKDRTKVLMHSHGAPTARAG
jgi:hypothetical protein